LFGIITDEIREIIFLTLRMAFTSTAISAVLGVSLGLFLERARFPGKGLIIRINRTLMGMPPVVMGLIVYMLLRRRGPLGSWGILFTVEAMILAQVLLITPIISGMVYSAAQRNAGNIRAFGITMGATRPQTQILLIRELSNEIYFAVIAGFGRAISEVGAIMIVGGNIQGRTRTMTTAITLLRNRGNYEEAITLGITLLIIAYFIQLMADFLRRKERRTDENN
jgi:tungstate transport system permease protein